MIHNLTRALLDQGWIDLKYPDQVLKEDFESLINDQYKERHQSSLIRFRIFSRRAKQGRRLLYHFTPVARNIAPAWDSPIRIYTAINRLALHNSDITRESIIDKLYPTSMISPGYYRSIFDQWYDLSGRRVLDLYCKSGSKALAVMLNGGQYFHVREDFDEPLRELADYTRMTRPQLDDGGIYDIIIISEDKPLARDKAEYRIAQYNGRASLLILMINKADLDYFKYIYKPQRILRINKGCYETVFADNYLLMIGQR